MRAIQHLFRPLLFALFALAQLSCQGRGRVHEAPAASYPDSPSAPAEALPFTPSTSDHEGSAQGDRYAPTAPPSGTDSRGVARSRVAPKKWAGQGAAGLDGDWTAGAPGTSPSDSARSRRPEREERPGLATHWGENRYSPARQVDFERRDAARPAASLKLHYDDRAGALALLPGGSWGHAEATTLGGAVRISMLDDAGRPFAALRHGERIVSMGDPGERYSLLVENQTGDRFEVVASVDGLDVLDGEDGALDKRGYLIGAYSSVQIDGFRRSDAEVAAFRLGNVSRSYAANKGKARNVGVIGFALFDERAATASYPRYREPWPSDDTYRRRTADPFPGRYAQPPRW